MPAVDLNYTYTKAQVEIFFPPEPKKYTIVTKGRRFGATRGAAQAFIEHLLDHQAPLLWVDTVNGNIDRYFDRYFLPALKGIEYTWHQQQRQLKIYGQYCDFRSADRPENIEGFGYRKIFLNEAGIILKDDYLYSNAILPMLLDYPDSQLIAAGVPKGKFKKDGSEHKFWTLANEAETNSDKYRRLSYTSFDNPFLQREDIEALEREYNTLGYDFYRQEILGEFIDAAGNNPFMISYDKEKHESESVVFQPNKRLLISIDYNLNPFSVIFAQMWEDNNGYHLHIFDEAEIKAGSIPAMADLIKERYGKYLHDCWITGDAMGNRGDISQRDNASYYEQLLRLLRLSTRNLKVPNNPHHTNSRSDCNYVLSYFPDFKIHPVKAQNTARDCKIVQCDAFGSIVKRDRKKVEQRGDFLDATRYLINAFLYDWIGRHRG